MEGITSTPPAAVLAHTKAAGRRKPPREASATVPAVRTHIPGRDQMTAIGRTYHNAPQLREIAEAKRLHGPQRRPRNVEAVMKIVLGLRNASMGIEVKG